MNNTCWWKKGVIYQIYPRSYQDTTGNGIGDLAGIIKKLPYLNDLGIDAIWINPFFTSPMEDFGYDISDYYSVDSLFGKNEDVLKLITSAHDRNIKVIFDLVLNHTSIQHPWFVESRSSLDNPKRDWYVWHDTIPNNWESIFGGSSWSRCSITGQYYYHSFLPSQPDLNLRNPEVVDELCQIVRHYLELGVDGFRLDAVNTFYEDAELRDNPIRPFCEDTHCDIVKLRKYDFDQSDTFDLLAVFKDTLCEYEDRLLFGEVSNLSADPDAWRKYYGVNKDGLDIAMNFDLLYGTLTKSRILESINKWEALPKGKWPSYALGSHDQIRFPSRLNLAFKPDSIHSHKNAIKLLSTFLLTVRGTPLIYYGDEIGMEEYTDLAESQIRDPWAIREQYRVPTRDGCRTPMLWDGTKNAGFTASDSTWLPIHSSYPDCNVDKQLANPGSILNHYKKLLSIRKNNISLQLGCLELVEEFDQAISYRRIYGDSEVMVILNMSIDEPISLKNMGNLLYSNEFDPSTKTLKPQGFVLYETI